MAADLSVAVPAVPAGKAAATGKSRAWVWGTLALSAGAPLLAIALAPPASASPGRGLGWVLFVASSGHVASTGWFYGSAEVRAHVADHRWRYVWVPVLLVLGTAVLAAALPPGVMAWFLLPYFGWQFFHFQKQNLGMAALAATSAGAKPLGSGERRAIIAVGCAGIAGLLAHPALLQVAVSPARFIPGIQAVFTSAGIAAGVAALAGIALFLRRAAQDRPLGLTLAYLMALAFFAPVFAFASPYAAVGGLTIAHGAQYLILMSLVAAGGGTGAAGTGPRVARALRLILLVNCVLIGGAALEITSHLHSGAPLARALFGMYLGVVMSHFVIDAGLWRLRDRFPRQFLAARVPYLIRHPIDRRTI